jgi:hypothetical protein
MSTGYASFQWTEINGLYLADGAAVVNIICQGEHPIRDPRYFFDLTLQYCFASSVDGRKRPRLAGMIRVKLTLEQTMKTQRGSRYIDLLFLQPRC